MSVSSRRRPPERSGGVVSLDGKLRFVLKKGNAGVHVERHQHITQGAHTGIVSIQTLFTTGNQFARFCEADSMRFEYPLLYVQATRAFNDLIAADREWV